MSLPAVGWVYRVSAFGISFVPGLAQLPDFIQAVGFGRSGAWGRGVNERFPQGSWWRCWGWVKRWLKIFRKPCWMNALTNILILVQVWPWLTTVMGFMVFTFFSVVHLYINGLHWYHRYLLEQKQCLAEGSNWTPGMDVPRAYPHCTIRRNKIKHRTGPSFIVLYGPESRKYPWMILDYAETWPPRFADAEQRHDLRILLVFEMGKPQQFFQNDPNHGPKKQFLTIVRLTIAIFGLMNISHLRVRYRNQHPHAPSFWDAPQEGVPDLRPIVQSLREAWWKSSELWTEYLCWWVLLAWSMNTLKKTPILGKPINYCN